MIGEEDPSYWPKARALLRGRVRPQLGSYNKLYINFKRGYS